MTTSGERRALRAPEAANRSDGSGRGRALLRAVVLE
jgi:hypothetical protein